MDNLEKFIRDNREEFDSEVPREELWKKIESSVDSPTNTSLNWGSWMWKAAAVFLLFSTTWLLMDKWQQPSVHADYQEDAFTEEFKAAEQYYLTQIGIMQSKLVDYQSNNQINAQFMQDLERLDSIYMVLKNDFANEGDSEKVADAMIQNLRIRMEIINQQLMILERINQQTKNENLEI